MQRKSILALAVAVSAISAAPAAAVTNFTTTFDSLSVGAPGWTTVSAIEGWTGGPLGIEVQAGVAGTAASGLNLVELDTSANSFMTRTIDAGIYNLSFSYSARPGIAAASNKIAVYFGSTLLGSFTGNGTNKNNTNWLDIDLDFTAATAGTLKFAALGTSDGVGGYVDDITLAGSALPVPEPGEWAMIVAGLGVIGAAASRRRTN